MERAWRWVWISAAVSIASAGVGATVIVYRENMLLAIATALAFSNTVLTVYLDEIRRPK